jgi:CarD family transcriptional regulator
MMQFSVGDKVIHPRFGAGKITGETHRELVDGFEHYFVIDVVRTGATAYVPMRKMDELGVRRVMSRTKLALVLSILRSTPCALSSDYKQRQAVIQEKLRTCRPAPVAEVVRDLTWHKKRKHLTQKDEALLNRGRELLVSEMALATDTQIPDAQETIDTVLRVALASGHDDSEGPREDVTAATVASEPFLQKLFKRVGLDKGVSADA